MSPAKDESSREVFGLIKKLNLAPDNKKRAKTHGKIVGLSPTLLNLIYILSYSNCFVFAAYFDMSFMGVNRNISSKVGSSLFFSNF